MAGKFVQFRKLKITLTRAGEAQKMSPTQILTTDFEIYIPSANTGTNLYIGDVDVDSTYIPRAKGDIFAFVSGMGHPTKDECFDLSKIYFDGDTAGDIAIIMYRVFVE